MTQKTAQPVYLGMNQPLPKDKAYDGTLEIHVDASDIARRIIHVQEHLPVTAGQSIYLLYPEWIPGHHRPSGPIKQLAGLVIYDDNDQRLDWHRDPYNVYAFRVDVPDNATALKIKFCFPMTQKRSEGAIRMTRQMLDLSWEKITLYPAGYYATRINTRATLTLPEDWQFGTALDVIHREGNNVEFAPIDYLNLIDSPVYAGAHFTRIELGNEQSPPVHMSIMADVPRNLKIDDELHGILKNIVTQMGRLYGAFHFNHYEFLFALSDKMDGKGLEHSRSSENARGADFFSDWKLTRRNDLFTHEFNHSWNGKYRRAAGHATPNFNTPMEDSLLWVYEGQTQLYGNVVAVRAGLEDKDTGMAKLADVAATYDLNRPAFQTWRKLADTTNDPTIAQRTPRPFRNYQGSEDYYAGGQLIWLAVDAKLRELSDNKICLDDFARAFFGINPGAWDICTYEVEDVFACLQSLVSLDWQAFINERLHGHGNLSTALESQGWRLVYTRKADAGHKAMEQPMKGDFTYSIGFIANARGRLGDVRWGGAAFNAGLAPGMAIIAVNGVTFSQAVMVDAIETAEKTRQPITLLVKEFDEYFNLSVPYYDGPKIPSLERIDGTPDYLSLLFSPRD